MPNHRMSRIEGFFIQKDERERCFYLLGQGPISDDAGQETDQTDMTWAESAQQEHQERGPARCRAAAGYQQPDIVKGGRQDRSRCPRPHVGVHDHPHAELRVQVADATQASRHTTT